MPKQVMTWYPMGEEKRKARPKSTWFDGMHGVMEKCDLRKWIGEIGKTGDRR